MLLLVSLALATDAYSDDFEDGQLVPWRVAQGTWSESGGALHGEQSFEGAGLTLMLEHREPSARITVTTHVSGVGTGGITWVNGGPAAWCGVWAGHGDVYVGSSDDAVVRVFDGVDPGVEEEVVITVNDAATRVALDGVVVYEEASVCSEEMGNGEIGITTLAGGGAVEFWDWAVVPADVDTDGDGVPDDLDCAPEDPTISPETAETWYDGIDADCVGDDDYDQDHDGATVDVDCDDTDAYVYPGAEDLWYDGRDSDCAGNDDFDADGDGHAVEGAGGDDCDDGDPSTYAGATASESDGVDHDCSGAIDPDDPDDTGSDTGSDTGGADDTADTGGPPPGCGCGTSSPAGAVALTAALALALRRRRA